MRLCRSRKARVEAARRKAQAAEAADPPPRRAGIFKSPLPLPSTRKGGLGPMLFR